MIRINLPGYKIKFSVYPITWEEFFKIFEEKKYIFVYQEKTVQGRRSLYNRLVPRHSRTDI